MPVRVVQSATRLAIECDTTATVLASGRNLATVSSAIWTLPLFEFCPDRRSHNRNSGKVRPSAPEIHVHIWTSSKLRNRKLWRWPFSIERL
jgi:hypothetical protein